MEGSPPTTITSRAWVWRCAILAAGGSLASVALAHALLARRSRALTSSSAKDRADAREEGDLIDLESAFADACDFVAHTSAATTAVFNARDLLELYGLYKQATVGNCGVIPRARDEWLGLLRSSGARAKRFAWMSRYGTPRTRAMAGYVHKATTIAQGLGVEFDPGASSGDATSSTRAFDKECSSVLRDPYQELGGDGTQEEDEADGLSEFFVRVMENESGTLRAAGGLSAAAAGGARGRAPAGGAGGVPAAVDVHERDSKRRTLLHWATDHGDVPLVRHLLDLGADPNAADTGGQTPLHYAAICEFREAYELLVDRGAEPDREDGAGESPACWIPAEWGGGG